MNNGEALGKQVPYWSDVRTFEVVAAIEGVE